MCLNKVSQDYDVIVVGGGINGTGIARDCALRGISCLLIEKNDFSAGTSGASSGMIHGGPRYMLNDLDVTKLACMDSGFIQKIAPHLLFRVPFLYTVYQDDSKARSKILLEMVESFFEAYDRFIPLKNGKPHTRLSPREISELEPNIPLDKLIGGVTFDEWAIDVPRLCIANALDARDHGAVLLNHTEVTSVLREGQKIRGLEIHNHLTEEKKSVFAKMIVNATGPWSPQFGKMAGVPLQLRGSKGIHLVFDRRLFNIAIVSKTIDGREIFALPYENTTILGTTDDDFFGDLDTQQCTQDEIEYLLDGIERVFPAIRQARMTHSTSGVRPTLYARNVTEDELSRAHQIVDHEAQDGVSGLISLLGGKLASYRIMAEEVVDLLCKKLKTQISPFPSGSVEMTYPACSTHLLPLPGGDFTPDVNELAQDFQLDVYTVSRLVYRHGSLAIEILEKVRENPELGKIICSCEPVIAAEIIHVIENEMAYTLSDIRRRTRLASGPCQGTDCLIAASAILAKYFELDARENKKMIRDFMSEWWWNRACVLDGDQFKQEELNQGIHFCNNSLDKL